LEVDFDQGIVLHHAVCDEAVRQFLKEYVVSGAFVSFAVLKHHRPRNLPERLRGLELGELERDDRGEG
jgi:hypothetical protein